MTHPSSPPASPPSSPPDPGHEAAEWDERYAGAEQSLVVLAALVVCLIPTTIGALLSAIGIAGMDRLVRFNVLAKSGRAVEAAGDVDVLLLDKTGTITIGDRQASEFRAVAGTSPQEVADAALLASLADETPEGRSIVVLAGAGEPMPVGAEPIASTSQTRVSGLTIGNRELIKGAVDAVLRRIGSAANADQLRIISEDVARQGADHGEDALALAWRQAGTGLVQEQHLGAGVEGQRQLELSALAVR